MAKKLTYPVGYKKPPEHTRFKPGQSGNKSGRKKATHSLSMADIVLEELNSVQAIELNGVTMRVPVLRIMIKQYIRAASKGNTRALLTIMELLDDGLARKAEADRQAIAAKLPRPDYSKMTQDELTALYFETLKKSNPIQ